MKYDCIVVGAGLGGLVAALKLSKEGKKVLVLEKQNVPGGYATSFKRGNFTFDSCVHIVDALGPDEDLFRIFDDFNILDKIKIVPVPNFSQIIFPGRDYVVPKGLNNFIIYLKKEFAQEAVGIDKLFCKMKAVESEFDRLTESKIPSWLNFLAFPFLYPNLMRVSRLTLHELVSQYIQEERLKSMIGQLWGFFGLPPRKLSALYYTIAFLQYYESGGYYLKGTFSSLSNLMAGRLKEYGSEVKLNSKVKNILFSSDKKRVIGVMTEKGENFEADTIISNVNVPSTFLELINSQDVQDNYRKEIQNLEKSISATQIYFGLKAAPRSLGMKQHSLFVSPTYDQNLLYECILKSDYEKCHLELTDYTQLDSELTEPGKGVLVAIVLDNYENWKNLSREAYLARKKLVSEVLIKRIEKFLPQFSKHIEVMEIATPLTMERYTANPCGAIYGFAQTPKQAGMNRFKPKTKIKGLYLAGAWTFPGGGVHGVCASGYLTAEEILKHG